MTSPPPQHPPLLTARQLKRLEALPDNYRVVSARDGTPIVESPTGQTLRRQPNGSLAATTLIERVQAHLHFPKAVRGRLSRAGARRLPGACL
jgi:hypothetical protein